MRLKPMLTDPSRVSDHIIKDRMRTTGKQTVIHEMYPIDFILKLNIPNVSAHTPRLEKIR